MRRPASFKWSVMSPSDFVKFRLVEFDEETAVPVSELNPGGAWPIYVEAVDDTSGKVIASTTVALDISTGRPSDRDAYAAAKMGASSLTDYVLEQGYELPDLPRIMRAPLPDAYRA